MPHDARATDLAELLSNAAWLRRLASSLVGASNDPEDVAQDAWVALLRAPPRAGEGAPVPPPRSWLAEVLRNAARMRARGGSRRLRRDGAFAAAVPAEAPSPEQLLDRLRTQHLLAGLVAGLDEPYRSTLLLHYYEGLPSAEIARLQRVPAGTVRWRLKAGLARLRAALDHDSGGERRLWWGALLPLAGGAGAGWPGWLKGSLKGAWFMSRAIKIATAASLVAAGAWVAVAKQGPAESVPASAAPPMEGAPRAAAPTSEARRARDAMRDAIVAALREREAAPARAAAPPAPVRAASTVARAPSADAPAGATDAAGAADAAPALGHYEPAYIREVFREGMFPLMSQCYDNALAQHPKLAGKMVLSFTIVGDPEVGGVVDEADFAPESDIKDAELETCVRESLLTLTFDKPPSGGGYVAVKYPVEFAPGASDGDGAAGAAEGGG